MVLVCLIPIGSSLAAQSGSDHEAPMEPGYWPALVAPSPPRLQATTAGHVSIDLLRYPLSPKPRRMLRKALLAIEVGHHADAIRQLEETLAKYPSSAPYVYSLLGAEYLKVERIPEAKNSFEQAVNLLPHDPVNHANLGLLLAAVGQPERAKEELLRAVELDRDNTLPRQLLQSALDKH
jgi:tetratricopeptide (TPR) repeat protein